MAISASNKKFKFGLAVMRCQPYHLGHERLIEKMIGECEDCIVVLGTIQEWRTKKNPLTFEERKKLILNTHPRLRVLGIPDLGHPELWGEYVLKLVEEYFIKNNEKPKKADTYYVGSQYDAQWLEGHIGHIVNINRNDAHYPFISGSMLRDMLTFKDDRWKDYINPKNRKLVKELLYGKSFK